MLVVLHAPDMGGGGASAQLYWRVDDAGVLHAFERSFVKRGDPAVCGTPFDGPDGPAFERDLQAVRAANRLVTVHRYCIAAGIASRGR
jgi:hypothetical protein